MGWSTTTGGTVSGRQICSSLFLVLVVAACSGDGADTTTTTTSAPITTLPPLTSTTTTTAATTTLSPATVPPSTSTTAAPTTTMTPSSTTTTTTTTTTRPDPAEVLTLQHQGLGTVAAFGQEPDAVLAALSAVLGVPDEDSGWIDAFSVYGTCPMPEVRMVRWGNLQTFHTTADATLSAPGAGGSHFFHWRVSDFDATWDDLGLRTVEGVGLGDTSAAASGTYGVAFETAYDDVFEVYWFSIAGPSPGALGGTLDGGDPTSVIRYMEGGVGCGE